MQSFLDCLPSWTDTLSASIHEQLSKVAGRRHAPPDAVRALKVCLLFVACFCFVDAVVCCRLVMFCLSCVLLFIMCVACLSCVFEMCCELCFAAICELSAHIGDLAVTLKHSAAWCHHQRPSHHTHFRFPFRFSFCLCLFWRLLLLLVFVVVVLIVFAVVVLVFFLQRACVWCGPAASTWKAETPS